MSYQAGKANKFVGANKSDAAPGQLFANRLGKRKLGVPTIPREYQSINVGPELGLSFDDNQALPVEGSNPMLRNLSPFMVQVEPPLVFANEPTANGKSKAVGIYDAAFKGNSNGGNNSNGLAAQYGPGQITGGSPAEVLSKNYPDPNTQQSGDGKVLTSRNGVGKLGNPQIADLMTALDIVTQLGAVVNSPPLILLINPQNLTMNYTRIHQFTDRSRFGYIYQAWGEDQPRMSVTAKCGAFISGGRGVQMASRRDSASWQNLMSLFHLYRSNGYIYDTLGKSNAHLFVGGLSIHYDGWIYYGNMESFTWTHDESNELGGVEFSMEFVCSVMVDTSKQTQTVLPMKAPMPNPNDPRYSQNFNTPQIGGNTLSVGLGGNVQGSIFGGGPGFPASDPAPPYQAFGDPDFVTKQGPGLQVGEPVIPKGGGFVPLPPAAASNAASSFSPRPQPFKRGG